MSDSKSGTPRVTVFKKIAPNVRILNQAPMTARDNQKNMNSSQKFFGIRFKNRNPSLHEITLPKTARDQIKTQPTDINTLFDARSSQRNNYQTDNMMMTTSQLDRYVKRVGRAQFNRQLQTQYSQARNPSVNSQLPYEYLFNDTKTIEALHNLRDSLKQQNQNKYRHLKKYSVVIDKLEQPQEVLKEISTESKSNKQKVQDGMIRTNFMQDKRFQKINLRNFNQFIPFFAERDNVGNLISERTFQSKELLDNYLESDNPHQKSQKGKRSISEQDEKLGIFEQKFKCVDVFDQDYLMKSSVKLDQNKDIKDDLMKYIDQYKSREPIVKRLIKQKMFDKKERSKAKSKSQLGTFTYNAEEVKQFTDMYQPSRNFLNIFEKEQRLKEFLIIQQRDIDQQRFQQQLDQQRNQEGENNYPGKNSPGLKETPILHSKTSPIRSPLKYLAQPRISTMRSQQKTFKKQILRSLSLKKEIVNTLNEDQIEKLKEYQKDDEDHVVDQTEVAETIKRLGLRSGEYANQLITRFSQNNNSRTNNNNRISTHEHRYMNPIGNLKETKHEI
ncbi:UNKNOWN [Stylonychia lemnae]|uniref:Uncharacterized protein n=1 Tax=Stylonychia lemnae TaxID=5949 RepID=A0A078AS00_STYLE|nr:UNKNOWN [Stylonychia lemnae]|eukprot:CDW84756.1 UNKNOWN [Stylonychia lemnae]